MAITMESKVVKQNNYGKIALARIILYKSTRGMQHCKNQPNKSFDTLAITIRSILPRN